MDVVVSEKEKLLIFVMKHVKNMWLTNYFLSKNTSPLDSFLPKHVSNFVSKLNKLSLQA